MGPCRSQDRILIDAIVIYMYIPGDTASQNMAATRRFFESEKLGQALLARLPKSLGYTRVMPAMRFIEYDVGGYIRPHTDGVMFDKVQTQTNTYTHT